VCGLKNKWDGGSNGLGERGGRCPVNLVTRARKAVTAHAKSDKNSERARIIILINTDTAAAGKKGDANDAACVGGRGVGSGVFSGGIGGKKTLAGNR